MFMICHKCFLCMLQKVSTSCPTDRSLKSCHHSKEPKEKRSLQGLNLEFFVRYVLQLSTSVSSGLFSRKRSLSWSFPRQNVLSFENLKLLRRGRFVVSLQTQGQGRVLPTYPSLLKMEGLRYCFVGLGSGLDAISSLLFRPRPEKQGTVGVPVEREYGIDRHYAVRRVRDKSPTVSS